MFKKALPTIYFIGLNNPYFIFTTKLFFFFFLLLCSPVVSTLSGLTAHLIVHPVCLSAPLCCSSLHHLLFLRVRPYIILPLHFCSVFPSCVGYFFPIQQSSDSLRIKRKYPHRKEKHDFFFFFLCVGTWAVSGLWSRQSTTW